MPNTRIVAAHPCDSSRRRRAAKFFRHGMEMKRTVLQVAALTFVAIAAAGCQSVCALLGGSTRSAGRQFCDRAFGDASSASRAVEARGRGNCGADAGGVTVLNEPSIYCAAAATAGATGGLAATPGATAASPNVSIPATSPTAVGATANSGFPTENGLADETLSVPNSKSAASATSLAGATAGMPPDAPTAWRGSSWRSV